MGIQGPQRAVGCTFLGLDFDLTSAMTGAEVTFLVRERSIQKISDMVTSIPEAQTLRAGPASKLYCMLNFLEFCLGELEQQACRPSKTGSYSVGSASRLSSCLEVVQAVLATRPQRRLWWRTANRVLAASDAAEEDPGQGSGGFHLVFFGEPQVRQSFVADVAARRPSHGPAGASR